MKFVSAGMVITDKGQVAASKWRCPRCETEATITGD